MIGDMDPDFVSFSTWTGCCILHLKIIKTKKKLMEGKKKIMITLFLDPFLSYKWPRLFIWITLSCYFLIIWYLYVTVFFFFTIFYMKGKKDKLYCHVFASKLDCHEWWDYKKKSVKKNIYFYDSKVFFKILFFYFKLIFLVFLHNFDALISSYIL